MKLISDILNKLKEKLFSKELNNMQIANNKMNINITLVNINISSKSKEIKKYSEANRKDICGTWADN